LQDCDVSGSNNLCTAVKFYNLFQKLKKKSLTILYRVQTLSETTELILLADIDTMLLKSPRFLAKIVKPFS